MTELILIAKLLNINRMTYFLKYKLIHFLKGIPYKSWSQRVLFPIHFVFTPPSPVPFKGLLKQYIYFLFLIGIEEYTPIPIYIHSFLIELNSFQHKRLYFRN